MQPSNTEIPKSIVEAIEKAWPNGVVDMPASFDGAPFWNAYPELKASLSRIPGSLLRFECDCRGEAWWAERRESEEDWSRGSGSYHLFFLTPADQVFQFETDTLEPDEEGVERRYAGKGWIGCIAAISLVAPLAVARPDELELFDGGKRTEPDVEPHLFDVSLQKLDPAEHYRELLEDDFEPLKDLRDRIVEVLLEYGFSVLAEQDLDRPVTWLRASKEASLGRAGEPITVRTAFFFRGH